MLKSAPGRLLFPGLPLDAATTPATTPAVATDFFRTSLVFCLMAVFILDANVRQLPEPR